MKMLSTFLACPLVALVLAATVGAGAQAVPETVASITVAASTANYLEDLQRFYRDFPDTLPPGLQIQLWYILNARRRIDADAVSGAISILRLFADGDIRRDNVTSATFVWCTAIWRLPKSECHGFASTISTSLEVLTAVVCTASHNEKLCNVPTSSSRLEARGSFVPLPTRLQVVRQLLQQAASRRNGAHVAFPLTFVNVSSICSTTTASHACLSVITKLPAETIHTLIAMTVRPETEQELAKVYMSEVLFFLSGYQATNTEPKMQQNFPRMVGQKVGHALQSVGRKMRVLPHVREILPIIIECLKGMEDADEDFDSYEPAMIKIPQLPLDLVA